jgi:hypothetical protein
VRLLADEEDRALGLPTRPDRMSRTPAATRTATTTSTMSDGTPDRSMIAIGLPSAGRRKIFARKSAIVSETSMPLNMKA